MRKAKTLNRKTVGINLRWPLVTRNASSSSQPCNCPGKCWHPTSVHPDFIGEMACLNTKTDVSRQKLVRTAQCTKLLISTEVGPFSSRGKHLISARKFVRGGVRVGADRSPCWSPAFSVRSTTYGEISRGPTSVLIHSKRRKWKRWDS
jgi:hypothetical protein